MTDPIADMLTRIRNALTAKHETVEVPASNMKKAIAQILLDEGYIKSVDFVDDGLSGKLVIGLKYADGNRPVISGLKRVSKPGLRTYSSAEKMPKVLGGLGYDHRFHLQRNHDGQAGEGRERRRRSALLRLVRRQAMSRIGKMPVAIPAGVTVDVKDGKMIVKGPKGTLEQEIDARIAVSVEAGHATLTRANDSKELRAKHGLYRALLHNMVTGVTSGYSKGLVINGVGYKVAKQGNKIVLNIGYSHPVEFAESDGIKLECPTQTEITVSGIDKVRVGQVAANIRSLREPEPYHGYGIRYKDEVIERKEGKTAGK